MHPVVKTVLERLGLGLATLFFVSIIIFSAIEMLPGDFGQAILGQAALPETVAAFRAELGLDKVAAQTIGDQAGEAGNHISRNERKRLNFASELVTNPTLLFVDEPTTGLDSYMAASVTKTLKDVGVEVVPKESREGDPSSNGAAEMPSKK